MIKTSIATKHIEDSFEAGAEAAKEALGKLEGRASLLLVFSTFKDQDPQKIIEGVSSAVPQGTPIAGGTAGWGVLHLKEERDVTVNALSFDKTEVHVDHAADLGEDHRQEGRKFAEKFLKDGEPPKLLMIFMAGLGEIIPNSFLAGVREITGDRTKIIGGNTGDDTAMKSGGYQFIGDKALQKGVVGAGLWGDIDIDLHVEHGFDPLGFPREVTKAHQNIIQEIDGKPAISLYEDYFTKEEIMREDFFGTLEGEGFFFPLGIVTPDRIIARYIMGADESGSLICGAEVEEGSNVRVLQSQASRVKETAEKLGNEIKKHDPQCVLFFSCAMRRMILIPEEDGEINIFKRNIGENIPLIGFYSYGEFCIPETEKENLVHHETLTIASLREND